MSAFLTRLFDMLFGFVSEDPRLRRILGIVTTGLIVVLAVAFTATLVLSMVDGKLDVAGQIPADPVVPVVKVSGPTCSTAFANNPSAPIRRSIAKRTVVIKYLGLTPDQVNGIIGKLRDRCWTVSDIDVESEETEAAHYKNEVDYRADADTTDARQLTDDAMAIYKENDIAITAPDGAVRMELDGQLPANRFVLYVYIGN